jgi:hypothetical protein
MENVQPQQIDRRSVIVKNVSVNAASQATPECRENFFRSCEAHGGELATVAGEVRLTYQNSLINYVI